MFERLDTNGDGKLGFEEFSLAVPKLQTWGAKIEHDVGALFASIDLDGHGSILFDEFCAWAVRQKLDLEDDDDVNDMSETLCKTTAQDTALQAERSTRSRAKIKGRNGDLGNTSPSKDDEIWEELREKLPIGRDPDSRKKRARLFRQFDPNCNGLLSLAEVDAGIGKVVRCKALFDAKKAIMRAFQAAKDINRGGGGR